MRLRRLVICGLLGALLPAADGTADDPASPPAAVWWEELRPGLELGRFQSPRPSSLGDSYVSVLRIDAGRFDFELLAASATEEDRSLTAREWCEQSGAVAAINASMFQADYRTSVSLMRSGSYVNNSYLSKDKAVLAFDPLEATLPEIQIIDRECQDFDSLRSRYGTLVQSIRMVSCEQRNVWQPQERKWSTAAIAIDRSGRVLFIHCRSLYSVHDFIDILLALPIDLYNAMYVEGGAQAQLFARGSGSREVELLGRRESGSLAGEQGDPAWPVPNVIAVVPKEDPAR